MKEDPELHLSAKPAAGHSCNEMISTCNNSAVVINHIFLWSHIIIQYQSVSCGKAAMKHWNRLLPHQSLKWKMSLFSCLSAVSEISPSHNSVAGSVAVAHLTAVWALNKYLPTVKHKHKHPPPPQKKPKKTSVLIVTHLCVSTGSPGYPVPSSAAAVLTGLTDALHSSNKKKNVPNALNG